MEDAGPDPTQPASAITNPASRWERLIPLMVPMFAIAVLGIFFLPAHPNIEIYLHLWMLATLALFLFLRFRLVKARNPGGGRVRKTRALTGSQVESYQPDGSPVLKKGSFISDLFLGMASTLAVFAEVQLLIGSINPYFITTTSTSINFEMAAITLMMALLFITIFSVMLLVRGRRPERIIGGRPAFYGTLGIFAALLAAVSFLVFQVPRYIFVGPSAPWLALFAFAQGQAERIDKDAVLQSVSASPPYDLSAPYSPSNTPFELDFNFYGISGKSIKIVVLDVDPPRLLSIRSDSFYSRAEGISDELREYRERAATVKLSPREVYALTEAEGLEFGKEENSTVSTHLILYVQDDLQDSVVVPAEWIITYIADQSPGYPWLILRVDGATGKVVGRRYEPEDFKKRATPVPVASPSVVP
jgi:hypothetical protein